MALPPVGVSAVVNGAGAFISTMKLINATVQQSAQTMQTAAVKSQGMGNAFSAAMTLIKGAASAAGQAIMTVVSIIGVTLVAAIGLAVGALGGLFALGSRASGFQDIIDSFNQLTSAAGLSARTLTTQLQQASLGTVSKMDLLKASNEALIGTTKDLGTELGKNLPALMMIAQHQADATGKDTLEVFNSLVEGIRRGTARSVESIGISIDMAEAQRTYAASIGTSVEALNDEQKSLALLHQVMVQTGVDIANLGTITLDAGDLLARIGANITNIFDNVGLAIQPAFLAILQIIDSVVGSIATFIENSMPYIEGIANIIAEALAPVLGAVQGFAATMNDPATAAAFWQGAANSFGSFVAGVDSAATQIINVVTQIAQGIADLLLGNSPPPKGPLSNMTTGAANTMQAWLDGFVGQFSLDPIQKVAQQVTDMMGSIATASRTQVEARLAALDQAVAPFQNRLTIIKSTFDAIKQAAQPALDAIDRQMATATQALLSGDEAAAATVRSLDAQRASIQGVLDAQQQVVDNAQIQLALVQAQQAQERALLTIRQAQLPAVQAVATATKKASPKTPGAPKEPKPKEQSGKPTPGGSSAPLVPGIGGGGGSNGKSIGEVAQGVFAQAQLEASYQKGLGGAPAELQTALGGLDAQVKRIQSVTGDNNSVTKAFNNIKTSVETTFDGVKKAIDDKIDSITNPTREGSVPYAFSHLGDNIAAALNTGAVNVTTWFDTNITTPLRNAANNALANIAAPGSVVYFFAHLGDNISSALTIAAANVQKNIIAPIQTNIIAPISTAFNTLLGDAATPGSLLNGFQTLVTNIGTTLGPISSQITSAFNTAIFFLTGQTTDETTLAGVWSMAVTFLQGVPAQIGDALRSIGLQVWNAFYVPIIDMLNHVIDGFNQLKQNILLGLGNLTGQAAQSFQDILPDLSAKLTAATISLQDAALKHPIEHISSAPPGFITGGATGGLFSSGLMKVGERGTEMIASASKLAVFPHQFTQAVETLASLMNPHQVPYATPSVVNHSSSVQTDRSINANFYGSTSADATIRRMKMIGAFR